ncbi:MAG TPA: hypothetical protein ENN33_13215 [Ignavibacteria bacterium]|nr:hypothetical protein [Ignavibacteria bacterium]
MEKDQGKLNWDDVLVDLEKRSNEELREILDELRLEEEKLSCQRRILHGKIDIIKAELIERLKKKGTGDITKKDIDRLTEILAKGF